MKNKKSQGSLEFIILIGTLMFFFAVFFLGIQEGMSDKLRQKQNIKVKEIALNVQNEINLALEASEGYSRNFSVTQTVLGKSYDLNIIEESIYIRTSDSKIALSLPVANVIGDVQKGNNFIKKEGGIIYLNP